MSEYDATSKAATKKYRANYDRIFKTSPYIVRGKTCNECHEPDGFLHAGYCSKSKGGGVKGHIERNKNK